MPPMTESERERLLLSAKAADFTGYWWIPVGDDLTTEAKSGATVAPSKQELIRMSSRDVIEAMLAGPAPFIAFGLKSPHAGLPEPHAKRQIEPGNKFCIYQVGRGIVAFGTFATHVGERPCPSTTDERMAKHLEEYPVVAYVKDSPKVFLNGPIPVEPIRHLLKSLEGMTVQRATAHAGTQRTNDCYLPPKS